MKPLLGVSKFGEFTFATHFLNIVKNCPKKLGFVLQIVTLAWDEAILYNRWGIAAERG